MNVCMYVCMYVFVTDLVQTVFLEMHIILWDKNEKHNYVLKKGARKNGMKLEKQLP